MTRAMFRKGDKMGKVIGIDLGTTNSAVAVIDMQSPKLLIMKKAVVLRRLL